MQGWRGAAPLKANGQYIRRHLLYVRKPTTRHISIAFGGSHPSAHFVRNPQTPFPLPRDEISLGARSGAFCEQTNRGYAAAETRY